MPRVSSPLDRRVKSRFGGVRIHMRRRVIIGLAFLLGGPVISASLAATLTINGTGNTAIEFGQGSQLAIGCDTSINTAVQETWDTTTSRFKISAIVLSNLDNRQTDTTTTTNNQGCGNKAIKISLIDTASSVMTIGTTSNAPAILIVPTIAIDSTTVLAGAFSGTVNSGTGAYTGTNAPVGTGSPTWPTSTIWSTGTTDLIGGKATISAAVSQNSKLTFYLPTSISIDPSTVLRVALETQ